MQRLRSSGGVGARVSSEKAPVVSPVSVPPLGQPCSPGARRASAPTPLCVRRQITANFSSRCRAAPGYGHRAAGSAEQGRASPLPLMQ